MKPQQAQTNRLDPKAHDQLKIVLIGLVVLAAVGYGAWNLLFSGILVKRDQVRRELQASRDILEKNRALIRSADTTRQEYEAARKQMQLLIGERMPMVSNEVAWLGQRVATVPGITVDRVSSGGVRPLAPTVAGKGAKAPLFEELEAACEATCTYNELGRFLAAFEEQFPLARVTSVDLAEAAADSGKSKARFTLAFLRFTAGGLAETERPDAALPTVRKALTVKK